jgi:hypothetical protein
VLNKPYTKSEYKDFLAKFQQDKSFQDEMKQKFTELKLSMPVNANMIEQSENSTGDYLDNCKNCVQCFDIILGEDCKYCYDGANCADNMDTSL